MHPLDSVLEAMKLESSLFVHLSAGAPWGISFNSGYQARLLIITRGRAWFSAKGRPPVLLETGHGLIIRQGVDCALMDAPGAVLTPCSRVVDSVTGELVLHGGDGPRCEFISVRLSFDDAAAGPLFALLPDVVKVRFGDHQSGRLIATLELIGAEEAGRDLGADFVINRLLEVLFVQVVRAWSLTEGNLNAGWIAGLKHERLGDVLRLIHGDLAKSWTVQMLADSAAMSRSAFAALFRSVVGVAPLTYIANWRIYRAKTLLSQGISIALTAEACGYRSDIAFARAFRSATGVPPGQWRRASRGVEPLTGSGPRRSRERLDMPEDHRRVPASGGS
jgi:AraC-like DNA-binding protein